MIDTPISPRLSRSSKPVANSTLKPLALKSLRQRMGWTQASMARFLGLSMTQYRHLEYGKGGIKPELMTATTNIFQALKTVVDAGRQNDVPIVSNNKNAINSRKTVYGIARSVGGCAPVLRVIDDDNINPQSLRALREQLGWSQKDMAACIIYNRSYYAQLEAGARSTEWNIIPSNIARTAILDALVEIVNAGRGDEIPKPAEDSVESLETTWRAIFIFAHEVRSS